MSTRPGAAVGRAEPQDHRAQTKERLTQLDGLSLLIEPAHQERWNQIMSSGKEIGAQELGELLGMLTPEGAEAVRSYVATLKQGRGFSLDRLLEGFTARRRSFLRRRAKR